jgi:hypothetical protein
VHGKYIYDHRLFTALHGFFLIPRAWYFKMDGICAVVHLCDFHRFDPLILVLYGNVIICVG